MAGPKRIDPVFLDTPRGLITPAGTWFRTTTAQLETSYGAVLDKSDLTDLVHRAETYLLSHRSVALFAVALLLLVLPPIWSLALGLVVFALWMTLAPSLGNRTLGRLLEWLGWAPLQVLGYVVVLSLFGAERDFAALLAGIAWFVLIRWQLLDWLARPLMNRLHAKVYPLPLADQTLRAVIFSEAIRLGIPLDGFPSIARWLDMDDDER